MPIGQNQFIHNKYLIMNIACYIASLAAPTIPTVPFVMFSFKFHWVYGLLFLLY